MTPSTKIRRQRVALTRTIRRGGTTTEWNRCARWTADTDAVAATVSLQRSSDTRTRRKRLTCIVMLALELMIKTRVARGVRRKILNEMCIRCMDYL